MKISIGEDKSFNTRTKEEIYAFLDNPKVSIKKIAEAALLDYTHVKGIRRRAEGRYLTKRSIIRLSMVLDDFERSAHKYYAWTHHNKVGIKKKADRFRSLRSIYYKLYPERQDKVEKITFKKDVHRLLEHQIKKRIVKLYPTKSFPDNKDAIWWWEKLERTGDGSGRLC